MKSGRLQSNRGAYTLVELLVVIGIIALLISILMPALSRAKAAANSVACMANLRSIGQAMMMYASENRNAIVGSAHTSARGMWELQGGAYNRKYNSDTNPGPALEFFDWIGPLSVMMKLPVPGSQGVDFTLSNVTRWQYERDLNQFVCPSARDVLSVSSSASVTLNAGAGQAMTYNTAMNFMLRSFDSYPTNPTSNFGNTALSGTTGSISGILRTFTPGTSGNYWQLPKSYSVQVTRVGASSRKIFAADGLKNYRSGKPIEYTLKTDNDHVENNYADYGPYWGLSRSYDRGWSAGHTANGNFDGRVLSFRHGTQKPYQQKGQYRMNAVFFDGHAESLGEWEACDPSLWMPKGSIINNIGKTTSSFGDPNRDYFWSDVATHYNITNGYVIRE